MIKVFVQNEAGSDQKHRHDGQSLRLKSVETVSRAYPFPYGFVIGTTSDDGDNLDCFIVTNRFIPSGTIVDCQPVGLLEQIEDGEEDHNILAILPDESPALDERLLETFRDFISHIFDHVPGKRIDVGRLLPAEAAIRRIEECRD